MPRPSTYKDGMQGRALDALVCPLGTHGEGQLGSYMDSYHGNPSLNNRHQVGGALEAGSPLGTHGKGQLGSYMDSYHGNPSLSYRHQVGGALSQCVPWATWGGAVGQLHGFLSWESFSQL